MSLAATKSFLLELHCIHGQSFSCYMSQNHIPTLWAKGAVTCMDGSRPRLPTGLLSAKAMESKLDEDVQQGTYYSRK